MVLGISYFQTGRGDEPVRDYLLRLDEKDRAKIASRLTLLSNDGILVPPYGKKLSPHKDLYEIRSKRHRILYTIKDGNAVLLNAFLKTTQKTPQEEIDLALDRIKLL